MEGLFDGWGGIAVLAIIVALIVWVGSWFDSRIDRRRRPTGRLP
jgi:hypothetical protein